MKLQLIMLLAKPLLRALGQAQLAERLEDAIHELAERLTLLEGRIAQCERRVNAVVEGWERMKAARDKLPHADAGNLKGRTLQERAREAGRHVANVEGEGDEPPEDHV